MHELLQRNTFLFEEHVGAFKAANHYDIYAPETGDQILTCREPDIGLLTRLLRFSDFKRMTPFNQEIRTTDGELLLRVHRGIALFLSRVEVSDAADRRLGSFKQQFFSVGGAFQVLGPDDQPLCHLKGRWTQWDFRFVSEGREFAHVTKKWAGAGREFFTSADNYVLEIDDAVPPESPLRPLILSAVVCIDMVLKE